MTEENAVKTGTRQWSDEPLVLFVEGYSDLYFFAEFMEDIGHHDRCFIQDIGSKGRTLLHDKALLLLKPDNLARMQAVGVLLDADEDCAGAFALARRALKDAVGVDVPKMGEWVQPAGLSTRFGIFIVCGEDQKGEVETLAWTAWKNEKNNAPLRKCVDLFIECASKSVPRLKSPDKVRIGTVLSVLNEDDPRLGPGARAKKFDFKADEFHPLREFLRGMAQTKQ